MVLLDLELGETHGVDALRQFREVAPGMHVIIYTSHDEEDRIIQAAELGVDGYLLKGCAKEEIVGAIRDVHDGGTALEASVAAKLMHHMNKRSGRNQKPAVQFSKREMQVLELLATGQTNRDIGATLFISESTVTPYSVNSMQAIAPRRFRSPLTRDLSTWQRATKLVSFFHFEDRPYPFEFPLQYDQQLRNDLQVSAGSRITKVIAMSAHAAHTEFETGAF